MLTDAQGIPLVAQTTAANQHDVTHALPMVVAIPAVRGRRGRSRRRPERLQADKAYQSADLRWLLRWLGIRPQIACRGQRASGLGATRWVVERTISWLHQFRRLRIRYERRVDIHNALLTLGCALICFRFLKQPFC